MVEERRVFLEGIPFMMNECFLRFILETLDLVSPEKVVILRRGEHTSQWQCANAFLWFHSQKVAVQVARLLDGYKLEKWYKIWKASLAKTDPQWNGDLTLGCILWDTASYGCLASCSVLLHVATWQPRTPALKKEQEKQPGSKLKGGNQKFLHVAMFGITNTLWKLGSWSLHFVSWTPISQILGKQKSAFQALGCTMQRQE